MQNPRIRDYTVDAIHSVYHGGRRVMRVLIQRISFATKRPARVMKFLVHYKSQGNIILGVPRRTISSH
jgi:hypothetical protein